MYTTTTNCRACESDSLVEVFDLGVQPLANDFCTIGQERAGFAPLKVLHCETCSLAQLSVVVKPEILYANYPYVTSKSQMMQEHFSCVLSLLRRRSHKSLLEIGSNDGLFLSYCKSAGIDDVVGIDPAENLASYANVSGFETICGTFNQSTASKAGVVDIVVARHVFCHVESWKRFIDDLSIVTHENSTVFIEVPYLLDMLDRVEFDTIYHEHTSYLSIGSVVALLEGTAWCLERVEKFNIHGGAVGLFLRRRSSGCVSDSSVSRLLSSESGIVKMWNQFKHTAFERINRLRDVVVDLNHSGKFVCGFGASAKSTVWVNACKFTSQHIRYICDCTPQKIGKMSPGTDIPVVNESMLPGTDYAVLWAWNYKSEILTKNAEFREGGGKFIVPIPTLTIE